MDATKLITIVTLLVALSIAAERLVEIIKGLIPALNIEIIDDPIKESRRRCMLQILAVFAGILTAFLARNAIPAGTYDVTTGWGVISLGLLASGGSGFWNSILTYLVKVKDIKALEVEKKKKEVLTPGERIPGN